MSIHPESLLIWCPNNGPQRVAEFIVGSTSHLAASMGDVNVRSTRMITKP
jgi:hypothetical protein